MSELPPERRGLQGHLHLTCALDSVGRSHLRKQSFSAPFHLSKPFHDNGALVVNVVNPTAGLFRGDVARSEIEVEAGARLLLTTPCATRVHHTQEGRSEAIQEFTVRANGWLEVLPELFIPHQGARHRQKTRIEVETAGELCYLETLAPGRVAAEEIFAFEELDWLTQIYYAGKPIVREKFTLSPKNRSLHALRSFSKHPYVATFFVVTDRLSKSSGCWQEINALHGEGLWVGGSQLVGGGWCIKLLASDSPRLREAVGIVRESIHRAAGWTLPLARKL